MTRLCVEFERKMGEFVGVATVKNETIKGAFLGFRAWWACVCVRPSRKQRRKIIKGPFGCNWGLSKRFDFICESEI